MKAFNLETGEMLDDVRHFTAVIRPIADFSEEGDPVPAVTIEPYMPPQIQISDMMEAGLRLAASRKARFDTSELQLEEEEDVPLDPTREPGVDLVDVQRASEEVSRRLAASQKKASEAAQKAVKEQSAAEEQKRIEIAVAARLAKKDAGGG